MKKKQTKKLNHEIILSNINEAVEELERLKEKLDGNKITELQLQFALQHAYLHINFAWNARKETTKKYANLSEKDFNRWKEYPEDIDFEE